MIGIIYKTLDLGQGWGTFSADGEGVFAMLHCLKWLKVFCPLEKVSCKCYGVYYLIPKVSWIPTGTLPGQHFSVSPHYQKGESLCCTKCVLMKEWGESMLYKMCADEGMGRVYVVQNVCWGRNGESLCCTKCVCWWRNGESLCCTKCVLMKEHVYNHKGKALRLALICKTTYIVQLLASSLPALNIQGNKHGRRWVSPCGLIPTVCSIHGR